MQAITCVKWVPTTNDQCYNAGILTVLLSVPTSVLDDISHSRERILSCLNYILSLECDQQGRSAKAGEYPTKMGNFPHKEPLVHWCHGAPGAVFLFAQASEHTVFSLERKDKEKFLRAAIRSGEAVWRRGLLKKGPGACHGISGNAYTFLMLYRITNDQTWLYRAMIFADFMDSDEFARGSRTPDRPLSLFEGWAAAACLFADLLHPETACFPLYCF